MLTTTCAFTMITGSPAANIIPETASVVANMRFMIHQPSSSFGRATFTDSKIHLQEMESIRNDLYEVLAKNSGNNIETIIKMCENGDKWMKTDEAIELGFLDLKLERK